jgi:hypothetical protein
MLTRRPGRRSPIQLLRHGRGLAAASVPPPAPQQPPRQLRRLGDGKRRRFEMLIGLAVSVGSRGLGRAAASSAGSPIADGAGGNSSRRNDIHVDRQFGTGAAASARCSPPALPHRALPRWAQSPPMARARRGPLIRHCRLLLLRIVGGLFNRGVNRLLDRLLDRPGRSMR